MAYENQRNAMVTHQLIPRGISNKRILEIFSKVPRHEFVSPDLIKEAYGDHPLPIGEGQTISQPYMAALMTECLNFDGTERVLEVGTGSGYQTAILAELASEVYSIERFDSLAESSRKALDRLGYKNIHIKTGDGTLGWKEHAPFDAIIVTAAAPKIPGPILKQIKDGGKLVIPVGGPLGQILTVINKNGDKIISSEMCGCVFVPLIGREGWGDPK